MQVKLAALGTGVDAAAVLQLQLWASYSSIQVSWRTFAGGAGARPMFRNPSYSRIMEGHVCGVIRRAVHGRFAFFFLW